MSTEAFMDQMKLQLAQVYAQEFVETSHPWSRLLLANALFEDENGTVREKCFTKCITKPGSSLSGSESSCISRCVDRYIEATGIISKALFSASSR
ncbi:Tim10/DDP family zinc finger [Corchorus olitorius]|uniref:Mitochondrial import inner membrane translocase subunit n=1 Tax=Corchorus olitorius TaxID=93759 RepID=A0A1R3K6T7_9ROSI|nr:Tim10/DDP family zinc finger [Corchorus olitorius]